MHNPNASTGGKKARTLNNLSSHPQKTSKKIKITQTSRKKEIIKKIVENN